MSSSQPPPRAVWEAVADAALAHVLMLRDAAVLDDPVVAALADPFDAARRGDPPTDPSLAAAVAAFDERLEALAPAGLGAAATVGRARPEMVAATARLLLRAGALDLAAALDRGQSALLALAEAHAFTLMPAHARHRPVQPTTLAHYLGGVVAPLGRAGVRLRAAYAETNRSPLGAGALASTGLPTDRQRAADLLGFDGVVPNTLDAVAAVDHLPALAEVAAEVAAALRRLVAELVLWLRTDPGSIRVGQPWVAQSDPALPGHVAPTGLDRLVADALAVEDAAAAAARLARSEAYGPTGAAFDRAARDTVGLVAAATVLTNNVAAFVDGGFEVNRAYLANRAGRDHTTSGELADFLMAEEGLDAASARAIARIVVRGALEQGLEASGITPQMIDAAALLVIGREVGVEIERMGGFLAPRRLIERRTAIGAPAAGPTREWLELEQTRLRADRLWRSEAAARLAAAAAERARLLAEVGDGG